MLHTAFQAQWRGSEWIQNANSFYLYNHPFAFALLISLESFIHSCTPQHLAVPDISFISLGFIFTKVFILIAGPLFLSTSPEFVTTVAGDQPVLGDLIFDSSK